MRRTPNRETAARRRRRPAAERPGRRSASSSARVVAFIDLGTNSIRLLVARMDGAKSFDVVAQQKETVRLGEGEFRRSRLRPEAMDRAVLVCRQFAHLARSHGAREIVAVATSACREAANRRQFLGRLRRETGLEVHVISGKEEARLIYLGVSSGVYLGAKRCLFIDIGGGSTEVIVGGQHDYEFLDTLKLGALRLASIFFSPRDTGPVRPALYRKMQDFVRNVAVRTLQRLSAYKIDEAVGSSGTVLNLAAVARFQEGRDDGRLEALTRKQLRRAVKMLCAMTLEERREVPGLNPGRADIIVAGAAILDTLMEELGLEELRVTERSLRDGLPIDYLSRGPGALGGEGAARGGQGPAFHHPSFRERGVLQLGRLCGFDEPHAREVSRLSLELFDTAAALGLHTLGERERELLEHAAMLHDIGAFLSFNNHRMHSYYFIRNAELLGFDQDEIDVIATTALFHRKTLPRNKHPEFAQLDAAAQRTVRALCVFLRIAESLDRSHTSAVRHARLAAAGRGRVALEVFAERECHLELWGAQNHTEAFRKLLGRDLVIRRRDGHGASA